MKHRFCWATWQRCSGCGVPPPPTLGFAFVCCGYRASLCLYFHIFGRCSTEVNLMQKLQDAGKPLLFKHLWQ